jgi:uncharacterized small protein (DUF1192 family)
MTVIRRNPVNRLGQLMAKPGGKSAAAAIFDAEANLKSLRAQCLPLMDEKIAEIQAIVARCKATPTPKDLKRLYALGNELLEIAGVNQMGELGEAAFSLCELIDRFVTFRRYSWPALQVHLDGLIALRAAEGTPSETTKHVLAGLRQVAETIKPPEPAGT